MKHKRQYKHLTHIFVEQNIDENSLILLDKNNSNHLCNVLRKKIDDEIIIFNGKNGAWIAKISDNDKKQTRLKIIRKHKSQPKDSDIFFAFAPLKKPRLEYLMQKATEMGASIIQPVITDFTQVKNLNYQRLRSNIIGASEQCEILSIPKLQQEISLKNLINNWQEKYKDRILLLADETKEPEPILDILLKLRGRKIGLLIGPEGGFSADELNLMHSKKFIIPISLGKRILRADTAAVAALSLIQAIIIEF